MRAGGRSHLQPPPSSFRRTVPIPDNFPALACVTSRPCPRLAHRWLGMMRVVEYTRGRGFASRGAPRQVSRAHEGSFGESGRASDDAIGLRARECAAADEPRREAKRRDASVLNRTFVRANVRLRVHSRGNATCSGCLGQQRSRPGPLAASLDAPNKDASLRLGVGAGLAVRDRASDSTARRTAKPAPPHSSKPAAMTLAIDS
jgi:hypothetical protein